MLHLKPAEGVITMPLPQCCGRVELYGKQPITRPTAFLFIYAEINREYPSQMMLLGCTTQTSESKFLFGKTTAMDSL